MLKIVHFPDPILREKMPEFDFSNPLMDPKELEKEMIETMKANKGIGLSANQVGIRTRMFVMGWSHLPDQAQAYFNPVIVATLEDVNEEVEGCLSFPGKFVKIKRPRAIKAQWMNSSGQVQSGTFEGYDCRCFLHEFDHLEGIVYKDRISQLKWDRATGHVTKHRKSVDA